MSQPKSILLLGAGELGTAVLTSLAQKHDPKEARITLALRPQTAQNSENTQIYHDLARPHQLQIVSVDIGAASANELAAIFKDFDVVVSCTGFATGPGTQKKLTEAVLKAGVKRYFPWQFGVDYDVIGRGSAMDLFDEQLDVRDMLRAQSKTQWVIVSTGMFTSFLFEPSFGLVEAREEGGVVVSALGGWENRVTVTAVEDIGKITAAVVLDESIKDRVMYTTGETISYGRLAELVEVEVPVTREVWTVEELKEALRQDPENQLRKYRVLFGQGKGVSWDIQRSLNWQRAIDTIDVESWMKGHSWKP